MNFRLLQFALALLLAARALADSPFAQVQPVNLGEVRWTHGFWAQRFDDCRTKTIPGLGRLMGGTNYTQFLRNFEIAAGLAEGRARGAAFNDGDYYKFLEAALATLAVTNDPALAAQVESAIGIITQAQRADGYLHTPVLIAARNGDTNALPFRDRNNFEMYNLGHLMTTACLHHRVTGKTNLLHAAIRAADFLAETFSNRPPESARSSVCPSHYMGLVDLFRETREPRFLTLAQKLFAERSLITDGGDDNQDRVPFAEQKEIAGHAVRANYLYAGAADLFAETGDTNYLPVLSRVWTNLIEKKIYVTGACGALYDGASPDAAKTQTNITRIHQAYGRNYQLPNTTAHAETCANIGNVMWNWRMFLLTGEARYIDVAELALYNSVLAGGSLDGTNFFYTNPLRVTEPLPTDLRWPRSRVPFVSSFCCPPNLARTVAESASYAYAKSADTLWVNLYGSSTFATTFADGATVKLTQETDYPWNGRVKITVTETAGKTFSLKLRIPGWADAASVRVNRERVNHSAQPSSYVELRRAWNSGDMVELELPMPVQFLEANPLVEEAVGQLAVKRGPIVYCLEGADLPAGVRVGDVCVSADTKLTPHFDAARLGGVTTLEGKLKIKPSGAWDGKIYRTAQPASSRRIATRLIPYFAWGNRGTNEMSVWLRQP